MTFRLGTVNAGVGSELRFAGGPIQSADTLRGSRYHLCDSTKSENTRLNQHILLMKTGAGTGRDLSLPKVMAFITKTTKPLRLIGTCMRH